MYIYFISTDNDDERKRFHSLLYWGLHKCRYEIDQLLIILSFISSHQIAGYLEAEIAKIRNICVY